MGARHRQGLRRSPQSRPSPSDDGRDREEARRLPLMAVIWSTSRKSALRAVLRPRQFALWGVQISASFSKGSTLRAFARTQHDYYSVIGSVIGRMTPFVLGSVLPSRGTRPFYRVRLLAQTPSDAQKFCDRLQAGAPLPPGST